MPPYRLARLPRRRWLVPQRVRMRNVLRVTRKLPYAMTPGERRFVWWIVWGTMALIVVLLALVPLVFR